MVIQAHRSFVLNSIQGKHARVKRTLLGATVAVATMAGFAAPTFAVGGGYCSNSSNGCTQSMSQTPCAGHGAFGAFSGTANNGQQGSAVHGYVLEDKAQGTTLGAETGAANSALCGDGHN